MEIEGCGVLEVELFDNFTANAIAGVLPVDTRVSRWGDEVYFSLPADAPAGKEVESVNVGDVAWWVPGSAFCVFFGMTPCSDDRIRPASPVTLIGRVSGDPMLLRDARDGSKVKLRARLPCYVNYE